MKKVNAEEQKRKIRDIVSSILLTSMGIEAASPDETLDLDSLDLVEFVMSLEEYLEGDSYIEDSEVERFFKPIQENPITVNRLSNCVESLFRHKGVQL